MSIIDIDEIVNRLSTRFNKIFYDREFVCCVQEDLQVILGNKNKCCVVVFPLLGPNYLKAVRYQAKIFDLAVFLLGSDKTCSIAVCHKDHLIRKSIESEDQTMPEKEEETGASKLRRKRPERQLYVPPAQRRLCSNEILSHHTCKVEIENSPKVKKHTVKTKDSPKLAKNNIETKNNDCIDGTNESFECFENYGSITLQDFFDVVTRTDCVDLWWKYELFDNTSVSNFRHISFRHFLDDFTVFRYQQKPKIYILKKDYVLWQPKMDVIHSEDAGAKFKMFGFHDFEMPTTECNHADEKMVPLLGLDVSTKHYQEIMECFNIFCDYDVLWVKDGFSDKNCILNFFSGVYYIETNDESVDVTIEDWMRDNCQIETKGENEMKISEDLKCQTKTSCESISTAVDVAVKTENEVLCPTVNDGSLSSVESYSTLQKNNLKNTANLNKSNDYSTNTINVNDKMKSKNDHEEEKEIMRKAKENINRKTRPIIKYIDDANNTLKIGSNDNVNNWEDLFDEDGHLEEDLLKEIVQKVGKEVTIVKAKEDYSDYVSQQIEELEHMVELYDFPSSLETHDIIQAFNDIKSDAMYVKWVDDTHAILVLGSLSQAQKAVNLSNSLIKVRPMAAASRVSLATAYQSDLKPAMKRPPTNLQTARRLITSHLGQKSSISKERSARERDDLKAAREMKKLVKKNEQDAWDGNLRSSIR